MKTTVSIPKPLLEAAEALARRKGLSRDELFSLAISELLRERAEQEVIERLNAVYAEADSGPLDPILSRLQSVSLERDEW